MFVSNESNSVKLLAELQGVHVRYGENHVEGRNFEKELIEIPHRGSISRSQHFLRVPQNQVFWRSLWDNRPAWLKVVYCDSSGDRSLLETVVNVITSMPFIVIGLQTPRRNLATKIYANSIVGVGVASCLYHTSRGESRKIFRFGDYAMIATATLCLSAALRNDKSMGLTLTSALMIPFQPMLVTCLHTGLMEAIFARRVAVDPKLRLAHNLHTTATLVGGALFVADDMLPHTPYIHAAWHLAAALGVATCNKLLE